MAYTPLSGITTSLLNNIIQLGGYYTSTGLNGIAIGSTTPNTGAFTTLSASAAITASYSNPYVILNRQATTEYSTLAFRTAGATTGGWEIYGTNAVNQNLNFYSYQAAATVMALSSTGLAVTGTLSATSTGQINGTLTVGDQTANGLLVLNGSSSTNLGAVIRFNRGGTIKWQLGNESGIVGNTSDAWVLYDQAGSATALKYTTATGLAVTGTLSTTGNVGIGASATTGPWGLYIATSNTTSVAGSATGITNTPTVTYAANNDNAYAFYSSATAATTNGGLTGLAFTNIRLSTPTVTGTSGLATSYQLYIAAAATATTKYGIYQVGTDANVLGGGLQMGTPTGGDKGVGTINVATDIYKNNTAYTNPDYVLEKWATGKIVKYANKDGASNYNGLIPLSLVESFAASKLHLPRFGQKAGHGIFSGSDALLATVEEAYLYMFNHEKRILAQEKEIKILRKRILELETKIA